MTKSAILFFRKRRGEYDNIAGAISKLISFIPLKKIKSPKLVSHGKRIETGRLPEDHRCARSRSARSWLHFFIAALAPLGTVCRNMT
jgi:hypothetical protein